MFPNLLEQTDEDLVSLETILANDVDKIILPLESYGAICELGAFCINEKIRDKLIVLNSKNHSHAKSFINLGPIKLIKKKSKGFVLLYEDKLSTEILDEIKNKVVYGKYIRRHRDISNIFTLTYFIGLIIALFQPISKKHLEIIIKELDPVINIKLVDPAIEALVEYDRAYVSYKKGTDEYFSLTPDGFSYYHESIKRINKQKEYYKLRSTAIWTKSRKRGTFSLISEKAKLLECSTE